jgi:hypothetical protein
LQNDYSTRNEFPATMTSTAADNRYMRTTLAAKTTRVLIDRELADKAMRALGAKSKAQAVHIALEWIVSLEMPKEPA